MILGCRGRLHRAPDRTLQLWLLQIQGIVLLPLADLIREGPDGLHDVHELARGSIVLLDNLVRTDLYGWLSTFLGSDSLRYWISSASICVRMMSRRLRCILVVMAGRSDLSFLCSLARVRSQLWTSSRKAWRETRVFYDSEFMIGDLNAIVINTGSK